MLADLVDCIVSSLITVKTGGGYPTKYIPTDNRAVLPENLSLSTVKKWLLQIKLHF